jgi:predicted alpha/beta-hydrolase family hydrolase
MILSFGAGIRASSARKLLMDKIAARQTAAGLSIKVFVFIFRLEHTRRRLRDPPMQSTLTGQTRKTPDDIFINVGQSAKRLRRQPAN